MKKIVIMILLAMVISCTYGPRDRANIRQNKQEIEKGFFYVGMYRQAFFEQWGYPSKTLSISSDEFTQAGFSRMGNVAGGNYFKGKVALDVWIYKDRNVVAVFKGLHLEGWMTGKEAKEFIQQRGEAGETSYPRQAPPSLGTTTVVTVTWTSANIRSGAGNEFPVVTTVKQGDKLTVIGESGEWFNVRLENGQEGWIKSTVVK